MYASDSLEILLSHLSMRVMDVIVNGNYVQHLYHLFEFLAAWEKRPGYLTSMAYQWCSVVSKVAGGLRRGEIPVAQPSLLEFKLELELELRFGRRQQDPTLGEGMKSLSSTLERGFSEAGPGCDLARLDDASHQVDVRPEGLTPGNCADLLAIFLEIGFRPASPGHDRSIPHLDHTPHHDWVFDTAFSSNDDEVIADAVCAWIADSDRTPPSSCARYFSKRVESDRPLSPRLRLMSTRAIARLWRSGLGTSRFEIIRLLNHLDVDVDDIEGKNEWSLLLVSAICSSVGLEDLSSRLWRLLDKLGGTCRGSASWGAVMRSLEEAEDWEKLEVWVAISWKPAEWLQRAGDIGQVTLKLLQQRPSALPRFEDLCETGGLHVTRKSELQRICDQVRTERSPPGSGPPQYVSVYPAQHLSILTPPRFSPSVNRFTAGHFSPSLLRGTTLFKNRLFSGATLEPYIYAFERRFYVPSCLTVFGQPSKCISCPDRVRVSVER